MMRASMAMSVTEAFSREGDLRIAVESMFDALNQVIPSNDWTEVTILTLKDDETQEAELSVEVVS